MRFFPTYTCNHSCYTIYVRFFATYTCVLSCFVGFLFPSIWPFSYKRAYICAQKKFIYLRYKQACVYRVTESPRIRGTELYRQQKTSSCTMELKSNFSLNQEWPQSRNTVRKGGKYRNTASKIVKIPIPHILITFIISSAYLWLLPSRAFNYLRHLCIRCPCFFWNILVVRKFFANFHWKVNYIRSTFW